MQLNAMVVDRNIGLSQSLSDNPSLVHADSAGDYSFQLSTTGTCVCMRTIRGKDVRADSRGVAPDFGGQVSLDVAVVDDVEMIPFVYPEKWIFNIRERRSTAASACSQPHQ